MTLQLTTAPDITDDLFARPPRGLARQPVPEPVIAGPEEDDLFTVHTRQCLTDLDATRARVAEWLDKALGRLDANQAQWDAARLASAAADRWDAIQGALIAVAEKRVTPAALNATWTKRKAEGGALAELLTAYESYAATADQLSEELQRLHVAQNEINTAYLEETL